MAESLLLFETDEANRVGAAEIVDQNLKGPEFVDGWKDVLDARHPPYTDQSIEELCHYASHVRKPYVLVERSQVEDENEDED